MTPIERAQAVAMLSQAEALREQGAALMHLAEAQVRAANALLGAEAPSAEAKAAAEKIFGELSSQPAPRHYGSINRLRHQVFGEPLPPDGEDSGT